MLPGVEHMIRTNFRQAGMAGAALVLTVLIIFTGAARETGGWEYGLQKRILEDAQQIYMPVLAWNGDAWETNPDSWLRERTLAWLPLVSYAEDHARQDLSFEDEDTLEKILAAQTDEGNAADEKTAPAGDPDFARANRL